VLQVADVGTIINPVAHDGQLKGGFAFGLGAGMMEDLAIADGRVLTPSLGEYKLPTQMDMPPYRVVPRGIRRARTLRGQNGGRAQQFAPWRRPSPTQWRTPLVRAYLTCRSPPKPCFGPWISWS